MLARIMAIFAPTTASFCSSVFFRPIFTRHWPALLAWVALPLLILALPRSFHGNDDALIIEVLRGGHPAPFVGDGLSMLLAWLYTHASPHIAWYGGLLYVITCASTHAGLRIIQILGANIACGRCPWQWLGALILLGMFWAFSLHLTFTMVAIAACGVGALGFAVECKNSTLTWHKALAYGGLVAVGYHVRPPAHLAAIASLGAPCVLFLFWFLRYKRKEYAVALLAFMAPIAVATALHHTSPHLLTHQEQTYREYNGIRGTLQGFDKYRGLDRRNPAALKAAGWNTRDYQAFSLNLNFDEDHFPLAKIKKLIPLAAPLEAVPNGAVMDLIIATGSYGWPILGCLLLGALMFGQPFTRRYWVGIALMALQVLSICLVFVYLAKMQRVVARICLPMLLLTALSGLAGAWWIMVSPPHSQKDGPTPAKPLLMGAKTLYHGTLGLLVAGLLIIAGWQWHALEQSNHPGLWQQHGATLGGNIARYAPEAADKTMVAYGCMSGFGNGVDPLLSADPLPFRAVFLEWVPPSPFFYDCLRAAGIRRGADLIRDAYARPDILFLLGDQVVAQLEQYSQDDLLHPAHFELAYDIHWPKTGLYRLVNGPSSRFHFQGCPPGSIFRLGSKYNTPPALPLPPPLLRAPPTHSP